MVWIDELNDLRAYLQCVVGDIQTASEIGLLVLLDLAAEIASSELAVMVSSRIFILFHGILTLSGLTWNC